MRRGIGLIGFVLRSQIFAQRLLRSVDGASGGALLLPGWCQRQFGVQSNVSDPSGLERQCGIVFKDKSLLRDALRHPSTTPTELNESREVDQSRLEFLGDSVLGLIMAQHLFQNYPSMNEGQLTKLRQSVVNKKALADAGREINLGEFVILGEGEASDGGRNKDGILADTFEALIAAIYLDTGLDTARQFVLKRLERRVEALVQGPQQLGAAAVDHKSALQMLLLTRGGGSGLPIYHHTMTGPSQMLRKFEARVYTGDGRLLGVGEGSSKRAAEQEAARRAVEALASPPPSAAAQMDRPDSDSVGPQ